MKEFFKFFYVSGQSTHIEVRWCRSWSCPRVQRSIRQNKSALDAGWNTSNQWRFKYNWRNIKERRGGAQGGRCHLATERWSYKFEILVLLRGSIEMQGRCLSMLPNHIEETSRKREFPAVRKQKIRANQHTATSWTSGCDKIWASWLGQWFGYRFAWYWVFRRVLLR